MSGEWGTVCDDSWGDEDTIVVCRQLGYTYGTVERYNPGTGLIYLDDVQCFGTEDNLLNCPHPGIGNHDCTHEEDIGVSCSNEINDGRYSLSTN